MLAYLIYGVIIFLMKILSGKFVLKSRIPQEPLLCNDSVPYCVLCLLNSELVQFECGKQRGFSLGIILPWWGRLSQHRCFFHLLSCTPSILPPLSPLRDCCRVRRCSTSVVPNLFGTRDQLHGRQFSMDWGERGMVLRWFKSITFIVYFISIIYLYIILYTLFLLLIFISITLRYIMK